MGDTDFNTLCISEQLVLRRMKLSDKSSFHKYRSNCDVARFQSWNDTFSLDDATTFIEKQIDTVPNVPGSWIQLAIANRDTDELLGDVAFSSELDEPQVVQVGVTIAPTSQQNGVAFQALSTLLHYLFVKLGKHRVVATIDARNTASIALFKKLRFRQEAHFVENVFFKGEWGSEVQFAMLRREYTV